LPPVAFLPSSRAGKTLVRLRTTQSPGSRSSGSSLKTRCSRSGARPPDRRRTTRSFEESRGSAGSEATSSGGYAKSKSERRIYCPETTERTEPGK
jgi:hypothetical protein